MSIFSRIWRSIFGPKTPLQPYSGPTAYTLPPGQSDDDMMQHLLSQCIQTGGVVIAHRQDDDSVEVEILPD